MKTKERMIHQYVREKFEAEGKKVEVPHYTTLAKVWKEWFGAEGARQRYIRSAAAVETGRAKVVIVRPGQVVALDTTPLPVKVLDDVFGTPISVHLTLALDTYSHSLVAFRLTPVSDSSVEVAMLLRDVLLPLPMRPDWGEELEWPYPGVPAALVAEFAGAPGGGSAVLRSGDGDQRSRQRLQESPDRPGRAHVGGGVAAGPCDASDRQD
ncbi:hypothetical protein [Streptomyces lunaelactis]|uniref:hypothetical protein n=1 Tax=Streptomyces lunaelactis TaxID=1535768 RepID=UPI0015850275|nr:hypothetical protein [Streptomyces lunaelactis]NUK00748.1 hypothetical protein [Streptomyces lunaelactis]NUK14664.1 hypothetical protein [Streptomyces lunaelactis]